MAWWAWSNQWTGFKSGAEAPRWRGNSACGQQPPFHAGEFQACSMDSRTVKPASCMVTITNALQ